MKIYFLDNKEEQSLEQGLYNSFVADFSDCGAELPQSDVWYNFSKEENKEAFKVLVTSDNMKVLGSALVIKNTFSILSLFNFSYLYCPRGPIFAKSLGIEEQEEVFLLLSKEIRKKYKPIFLRFEAIMSFREVIKRSKRCFKKTIDLQPAKTLMIDLDKSEEEILAQMHQKTRYNIRLARKKGVKILEAASDINNKDDWEADFNDFWQLLKKTSARDTFNLHSKEHYRLLLLTNPLVIKLFFAQHQGQRIACGIFSFFANKVTYLHGASDNDYRQLMAPHLLQFEMMMRAKKEGYRYYDFYGIDEKKWPGVTKFKMRFAGFVYDYNGTYDYIFCPFLYYLYIFLRKIKRTLKSL